jgi:DNA-binding transcriptional LysR family regulator
MSRGTNEWFSGVMKEIQLHRIDLNLLVVFEALMREGSVSGAAVTLNKTPSAVSHALARLREQVGDPLMVKVGGRMQASPFALQLIEDIQPILNSIKRVLQLPQPFDPGSSDRIFRIASPIGGPFLADVVNALHQAAPGVGIEWLSTPRKLYAAVAEGLIDLAHLGGERRLPDGLVETEMPPMNFVSFVRQGHPAIDTWGPEAWLRYDHVKVAIHNEVLSPVDEVSIPARSERRIGALISEFSGVGPLLASSDLIATLPTIIMAEDMETYGLVPLPELAAIPPFRARFFWSSRTANDPALVWVRKLVLDAYRAAHDAAETRVRSRLGSGQP